MLSCLPLGAWALLVVGAVAIGVSKTALPGVTTLAVAIFAAVLPARASTGTILLLLLVADAVAITTYWRDADWTTLRRLVPGVLAGVLLGAVFLGVAGDRVTKVFIGVLLLVLIAVTLLLMRRPRPPQVQGRVGRAVYGTLAGFTTMSANAGGPVMSMYLLASDFAVTSFLGTSAWFFFLVNVVKLPFSVGLGVIRPETLWIDLVLAPVVLASAYGGRLLAARMDPDLFGRIVTVLTVLSSLYLVASAF